ncbi:MAG: hypothetical protein ACP5NV_05810 [Candidatus Woesearchaeota archaeon]
MPNLLEQYDPRNWKKQLHFEKLKIKFSSKINSFVSYQSDLAEFLKQDALRAEEISISSTFLVFDQKEWMHYKRTGKLDALHLLGYVTVMTDSIRLDGDLKTEFRKKGIEYKSLPALKIGRLCVDDTYLKRHIGACILAWVAYRVSYLNTSIACRFVTLDAKRHSEQKKDSYHFYKKYGFRALRKNNNLTDIQIAKQSTGTTSMYIDLYHVIRAVIDKQLKQCDTTGK